MSERTRLGFILLSMALPMYIGYAWAVREGAIWFGIFITLLYGFFIGQWWRKFRANRIQRGDNMSEIEYLYNRVSALEAIIFEMKYGFTVGDKLLITPPFHALMVEREQWRGSYPFANEYPVGGILILKKVYFDSGMCDVRLLDGGGIGAIPIELVLQMRQAYQSEYKEAS